MNAYHCNQLLFWNAEIVDGLEIRNFICLNIKTSHIAEYLSGAKYLQMVTNKRIHGYNILLYSEYHIIFAALHHIYLYIH